VPAGSTPFAFAPWASPEDVAAEDADATATAAVWARRFPGEPFHLVPPADDPPAAGDAAPAAAAPAPALPPLTCNLAAAVSRQALFLWQVSGPQYEHAAFLADGARRYAQLLLLMRGMPGAFLVPTFDMDLMVRVRNSAAEEQPRACVDARSAGARSGTRTWRGRARTPRTAWRWPGGASCTTTA
jgi:hypothetical protein